MARLFFLAGIVATTRKKRSKSKKSGRSKAKPAILEIYPKFQEEVGPAIDLDKLRREIKKRVTSRALELVDDTIEHIKDGNFQAMKYLFEAVGLLPINSEEVQPAQNELGKKLSDLLDRRMQPEGQNPGLETAFSAPAVK